MSPTVRRAVVIDAAAWLAVQASAGYLVHRLPRDRLAGDGWLFRERAVERGGRLYARAFHVNRWKHRLPEAGTVFAGGFDKSRLRRSDDEHLSDHVVETCRAELGHWLAMAPLPAFLVWNPPRLRPAMAFYAVAVNVPCIVAVRYNRIRLLRVLARRQRTATCRSAGRGSAAARAFSARGTTGNSMP